MNVLQIVSNKVWGGGERYALDLSRRLIEDDHSVAVITRGIEAVDKPFADAGIPTAKLPLKGVLDLVSPMSLAKVLNRMSAPIVVHVHNFKDARTAVRARKLMRDPGKVRIVCTRHLVKAAKTDRSSVQLYCDIDAIIFVSETAKEAFLSSNPKIDSARLHVVHNSIKAIAEPEKTASGKDENITLAFIGRISPEKGLDVLLKALRRLEDLPVKLLIAGTGKGTDVMPLVRMTREGVLKDRVEWLGHVDNPAEVILRADIGVVPSVCTEAFPLSTLEFMSRGVAVVATAKGGTKEIIADGVNGLLVPAEDPEALAGALRLLVENEKLRKKLSKAAAETVKKHFEYDDFYWRILKFYES